MKTSKLPPELVEKMFSINRNVNSASERSEQCAQIAVEYSKPFKDELSKWV